MSVRAFGDATAGRNDVQQGVPTPMMTNGRPFVRTFIRVVVSAACVLGSGIAWGTTYNVNSVADVVDANIGNNQCLTAGGVCTLRAAIQESNAHNGTDTITIPAGTYTLSGTTQDRGENIAAKGDLDITDP